MRGDIERVISALESAYVRYLVVGGVAVVLHGYLRTTADLDLVIQLERANVERAISALTALGLQPRIPVAPDQFADPRQRSEWVSTKGMTVFSLWDPSSPGFSVDLFAEEPFDFDTAHARATRVPIGSAEAAVVGRSDLIAMKRAVARPRDLDDVLHLEAIEDLGDDQT